MARGRRAAAGALMALLAVAILASCVPVGAVEHACDCCTSESPQIDAFTIAGVITIPVPPIPIVLHIPALEPLDRPDDSFQYALHHSPRFSPPGVPRYLLAASLLI